MQGQVTVPGRYSVENEPSQHPSQPLDEEMILSLGGYLVDASLGITRSIADTSARHTIALDEKQTLLEILAFNYHVISRLVRHTFTEDEGDRFMHLLAGTFSSGVHARFETDEDTFPATAQLLGDVINERQEEYWPHPLMNNDGEGVLDLATRHTLMASGSVDDPGLFTAVDLSLTSLLYGMAEPLQDLFTSGAMTRSAVGEFIEKTTERTRQYQSAFLEYLRSQDENTTDR